MFATSKHNRQTACGSQARAGILQQIIRATLQAGTIAMAAELDVQLTDY